MSDLTKQAMGLIKNRAKSQGLTQQSLAQKLGVSLPTIKRWYSGGTMTLDALRKLSNEVGITLTEIFSSIEEGKAQQFNYTPEQELYFSENPSYLAFFDNLLRGHSPQQIQKKFNLSEKKVINFLGRLEKLKLIEWQPKNKARLLVQGEPVWKPGGPLATKMRSDIFQSFLRSENKSKSHFFLHDYLEEDIDQIKIKIEELIQYTKRANSRAKFKPSSAKPMACYLSLQNFRWELDGYLKE